MIYRSLVISMIEGPPKKRMVPNIDIRMIEQYSAKKNITKGIAECSVKKPATSSDSASGRSKGVRLVSANIVIKNIMNNGKRGMANHTPC